MSIHISNTTRTPTPSIPFKRIKDDVLGKRYDVSLVLIGDTRSKRLNISTRQKTYIPNVLAFPLTKRSGEIYINARQAAREAKRFSMTPRGFVGFLFIHALLHLKGYRHGATMERVEACYTKRYFLS